MNHLIAVSALASAERLAAEFGPGLPGDVEAALYGQEAEPNSVQYLDPLSLGSLIASVATLAWTVYTDLRKRTPEPSEDDMTDMIRKELGDRSDADLSHDARIRVIEVIVSETIRTARQTPPPI
jgi:hypothetical protein